MLGCECRTNEAIGVWSACGSLMLWPCDTAVRLSLVVAFMFVGTAVVVCGEGSDVVTGYASYDVGRCFDEECSIVVDSDSNASSDSGVDKIIAPGSKVSTSRTVGDLICV